MSQLLTIVIPTYERRDRLKRSIAYWLQSGYQIVVADGSAASNSDLVPKPAQYSHDPDSRIVERWINAIRQVKTEYILLCADDDFVGLEAISKCLKFLQANPDYSCAQGQYVFFESEELLPCVYEGYTHIDNWPREHDQFSPRLCKAMDNYMHCIYSVQRTKNVHCFLNEFPVLTNDHTMELQFTICNAIFGKHHIFESFYALREIIKNSGGQTFQYVGKWYKADRVAFNKWRAYCVNLFVKHQGLDLCQAENLFDQAFSLYIADEERARPEENRSLQMRVRRVIRNTLPTTMVKAFRFGREILRNFFRLPKKVFHEKNGTNAVVEFCENKFGPSSVNDARRMQRSLLASYEETIKK